MARVPITMNLYSSKSKCLEIIEMSLHLSQLRLIIANFHMTTSRIKYNSNPRGYLCQDGFK